MSTITNAIEILKRRYYVMPTCVYMIRRISDGLFSTGGSTPKFTTVGKVWKNLNTLHNHLALFKHYYTSFGYQNTTKHPNGIYFLPVAYNNCEIVECEIVVKKATKVVPYLKEKYPLAENL